MASEAVTAQGLEPVSREARQLGAWAYAVLWGDLGIGLLVLLAGSFLVPALSLPQALGAIVVGSVIGVALLGPDRDRGQPDGAPHDGVPPARAGLAAARTSRRRSTSSSSSAGRCSSSPSWATRRTPWSGA